MNGGPIGMFDSGVGGLSVLRAIRAVLPAEDVLYVADSMHVPYGEKPAPFIENRSIAITEFLRSQGAKAIVVACNTATSAAIMSLRARFPLPIIGMEPALKPAAQSTRSGVVGVLATGGTLAGGRFASLLDRFGQHVEVRLQACPGLVERVEAGDLRGAETRVLVGKYVVPLLARGVDTIVLGCTHFPFLQPLIQEIAGPGVAIVDPNPAVARELKRRLAQEDLLANTAGRGTERFWTSAVPHTTKGVLSALWGAATSLERLPAAVRDA